MGAQNSKQPQSPLEAFETYVGMARRSPLMTHAKPEDVLALVRPFLANPDRNEQHVREIVLGYMMARFMGNSVGFPLLSDLLGLVMRRRFREEVARLESLENTLRTELKPGNVTLHVKPVRYLETPQGFAEPLCRYRIQVQLLIDEPPGDAIEAVSLEIKILGPHGTVNIEDICPKPAFIPVTRKEVSGAQIGLKEKCRPESSCFTTGRNSAPKLQAPVNVPFR